MAGQYTRAMTDEGTLLVRPATVSDVGDLARLRYAWRAGERGERGLDQRSFETSLRAWMEEHRSTHLPFLALRDGHPIGMAWIALVDRVPGPEHLIRRSAYIQSAYVVAGERSKGVGTRLLTFVLDHAQRLGLDYLAVHPSERSFSLYGRLGFAETDRVLELRS
jgi:GNAT superfamily N-acetyltransferase